MKTFLSKTNLKEEKKEDILKINWKNIPKNTCKL